MESFLPIVQFLLPEFILENFSLTSVDKDGDTFHVRIEEKNTADNDSDKKNLRSKGFFPTITIQDFPIRGHKVFLHIKRRRWLNTKTGKVVYRDWAEVAEGTRMTSEFAAFLKPGRRAEIGRYQPE
ncbi:transposase family protein [Dyadobacter sp. Leaf189]|uniref:ISAon1 family transposase N-terminal region protein n=1 Tax=Dyadobacter sp. Leaf189 TaxID=1736295 RepID=UPI0006F45C2D|nr:transposase family protein [Dyadobacter sp. Leaf189]KQS24913.1 transposase [Dyadobacter sp. Leaf189]